MLGEGFILALNNRTVLLYYKSFERDSVIRGDHRLKRAVRPLAARLLGRPATTGFDMWCQLLVQALQRDGWEVRMNDVSAARRHPEHPVGLIGNPRLLDGWALPNPAVLGPALFDHPRQAPNLMTDVRFRYYLVTCDWMRDQFAPVYGRDRVGMWHAGIDTGRWPDSRDGDRDVDVLIYDKVRWEREELVPRFVEPIREHLANRGLRAEYLRYGNYHHSLFAALLSRSKSMIFLCEHETQGLAYQEALASNVPILAWDPGTWRDPQRITLNLGKVPTSSVPYFSDACGVRFRNLEEFFPAFERFWTRLDSFRPRSFVETNLSLSHSAQLYMGYYQACLNEPVHAGSDASTTSN
jgi:hypothetical protein